MHTFPNKDAKDPILTSLMSFLVILEDHCPTSCVQYSEDPRKYQVLSKYQLELLYKVGTSNLWGMLSFTEFTGEDSG